MKMKEDVIRTDTRKLSKAVEYSPATIVITDTEGIIEYVNPSFTRITGYSQEEVIGKNPRILQSEITPESVYEELWATILAGKIWRGQFVNKKANGELYWEDAWIAPIQDEKGTITHFVAIKEDITQQILAENELKEAYKNLEIYSSLLHHDMSNDLQIIMTQIEFLEVMALKHPKLQEGLETIKGASSRMEQLLKMLGSYNVEHEEDIETIIQKQVTLAKSSHRDLKVTIYVPEDIHKIRVQGLALFPAVLDNLLRNTYQHAGKDIEVIISLSIEDDSLRIQYEDNGPGISPQIIEDLFKRGVSTTPGGGLGLYLSKRIVEGYNGTIQLSKRAKGESGVCFDIRLPAVYLKK